MVGPEVSTSFRQLARDVAVYGLGDVLLRATAIITMPIYTRIFSVDDYGILSLVLTLSGLLGAILILGGDSAYARFFFETSDVEQRQRITSSWFGFLALWAIAVALLCLPLAGFLSRWSFGDAAQAPLFVLALMACPITLINTLCGQVLRNQFQARLFSILNVVTTLLSIGLSLFAVVRLQWGLAGVLAGALAAAAIMLPVRLWTARGMLRPVFSFDIVRSMLAFGVPLVPASLGVWVFMSSDRIILGKLSTLDQLGLFAVATSVASLLVLVNGAIGQAWTPHAFQVYENQPEEARVFYGQVLTYLLIGFGILTVGITAFASVLLRVLAAPAFAPAAIAVGPLALGVMANASVHVTAAGISLTKKTKYLAMASWGAALVNIVLNLLLVPRWGMLGSSWAMATTYLALTLAYFLIGQRLWPVVYETRRTMTVVTLTVLFTMGAMALPAPLSLASILLKSGYCLAFVAALVATRVIDRREWQGLMSLLPWRAATATMGSR